MPRKPYQYRSSYLHPTAKTENQVQSGLLLDIIVAQSAPVLQLLAGKDKTLLVWGDALLFLNLVLDVVNSIRRFNFQGDGLPGESLHEDLHTATQTKDKVESGLLLDVIVAQSAPVLQLLAGKDKTLLVWGDALLFLNLVLYVVDRIRRLNLESNSFTGKGFDKNLHTTTQAKDEVESGLFLNVVVGESSTILKLLASENQTLLVRRDALLLLDLVFDIIDGVRRLDLKSDRLSGHLKKLLANGKGVNKQTTSQETYKSLQRSAYRHANAGQDEG